MPATLLKQTWRFHWKFQNYLEQLFCRYEQLILEAAGRCKVNNNKSPDAKINSKSQAAVVIFKGFSKKFCEKFLCFPNNRRKSRVLWIRFQVISKSLICRNNNMEMEQLNGAENKG